MIELIEHEGKIMVCDMSIKVTGPGVSYLVEVPDTKDQYYFHMSNPASAMVNKAAKRHAVIIIIPKRHDKQ